MENKSACKFNISYLNSEAKQLRSSARKAARAQGFVPVFDKGYIVGINNSGNPFVQVVYTINGITQCSNCAI